MIYVYAVLIFLITTCIGSFMNVVIYRLPNKMNLATPPSHCPKCNARIRWYDNIPLFSWIFLGGKCRYCKEPISPRYIIVEALTGIISTAIFIRFYFVYGLTIQLWLTSLIAISLFLCLIPISFIDIEHMEIPDIFIFILLGLGILSIFIDKDGYGRDWASKLIGAGGVLVFSLIIIGIELLFKKEFLGFGDLKLFFVVSFFIGWQQIILVIGIASILACVVQLIRMFVEAIKNRKNKKDDGFTEKVESKQFPFGPFIAIATILVYTFGVNVVEWWLSLLSF